MAINSSRAFSPESILANIKTVKKLGPAHVSLPEDDQILEVLLNGAMDLEGLMPWSSNYTFLAKLQCNNNKTELLGIYKPGEGERPLWDFPKRTLSHREFVSYLISQVLGWPRIPTTVLRQGPHGLGSVQLFVDAEYEAHYFNMRDIPTFTDDFRNMALFDYIANNADRKGGHCLKGKDGAIWAIDHGLTFHTDPKLRTVIWEFSDDPVPEPQLADLARLQQLMQEPQLCEVIVNLISPREIEAFRKRIDRVVSTGHFPPLRSGRNVPYPPI